MSTFNLFAYGTLQHGGAADGLLDGCERVGAGIARGILYDIDGRFPAAVLYGAAPIHGEVWRCPADLLRQLDHYEGTAESLFRRVATHVELAAGGEPVPCWVYVAGPALSRKLTAGRRVESGRWTAGAAQSHGGSA
jgi:gamma-glutamylcyclotransferase (GGCT)/AIG2-like uncharacterized protein YtfP